MKKELSPENLVIAILETTLIKKVPEKVKKQLRRLVLMVTTLDES